MSQTQKTVIKHLVIKRTILKTNFIFSHVQNPLLQASAIRICMEEHLVRLSEEICKKMLLFVENISLSIQV